MKWDPHMSTLKDKIVFITGASAGIGEACARAFAKEGARLVLAARRKERLEKLAGELKVDSHLMELDVTNRAGVEKAIAAIPDNLKAIDILVNNAGKGRGLEKIHEGNPDDWDEMIDTNVKGLLYVSRAVIPGMVKRQRGTVINIGSIAGHLVYPNGNVYCATKHAVGALTDAMRIDLYDTPIRVSTIDPGLVETEFSLVRFKGDADRAKKTYQGYKPLTGDDIADAAVWIASRPDHVVPAQIVMLPSAQANAYVLDKKTE